MDGRAKPGHDEWWSAHAGLDPLVKPRSVAIVGATDRPSPARSVIKSLGALGFSGAVYPVNPKYQSVLNHVCYPSLTELPEAPDVVVFSIRKPLIPEQVRLAAKRGARAGELRQRLRPSLAPTARGCRTRSPASAATQACRCADPTAWAFSIQRRA